MAVKSITAVEVEIPGLNRLLRDLGKLDKEYKDELRKSSKWIAERYMVPAFKLAAINYAGPWGEVLAGSVRAGRDRIPKVMIGSNAKSNRLGGGYKRRTVGFAWEGRTASSLKGATPTMVRYPSHSGDRGDSFAPFQATNWLAKARPTYLPNALRAWGDAVNRVCKDFNDGTTYG